MATYVLIHGNWHGGWCWKKVSPLLREAGHVVYTLTLTGLGERAHLLTREVGLATHIQDVLAVLECEELHDVILVGHSAAGILLPVIVDRATARLRSVVYLDAASAQSGVSLFDRYPQTRAAMAEAIATHGEGWRVPTPPISFFGVEDDDDVRWLTARLTPHPLRVCEEPALYAGDPRTRVPHTYIACIGDQPRGGPRFPEGEGMRYEELNTRHDAMITAPREVAELLLNQLAL